MATYTARDGKWWIRWRERKPEGGWRSRSLTLRGGERDAQAKVIEVENELERTGTVRTAIATSGPPASILDGLEALISTRVQQGRWSGSTPSTYRSYMVAIARALHEVHQVPFDQALPVHLLDRGTFESILAVWRRDGRGQMATYAALRLLLECWRWMADDPRKWAGVPAAPSVSKDYLPQTPSYARTDAPTIAHVDAMLRRLSRRGQSPDTVLYGVFLRYLSWRGMQVAQLQLEHVDLERWTATVETGKSQAESLARRVVPLPASLRSEPGVMELLTRAETGPVFRGRGIDGGKRSRKWLPAESFSTAWELATELDGVPRGVWNPPQRKNARPVHALRAAYQAHMQDVGCPEDTIDYLVGHKSKSVRGTHYGRAMVESARVWVDTLPAIEWRSQVLRLAAL